MCDDIDEASSQCLTELNAIPEIDTSATQAATVLSSKENITAKTTFVGIDF